MEHDGDSTGDRQRGRHRSTTTATTVDPPKKDLAQRIASATRWSFLNMVVIRVGTFSSG